MRRSVLLLTMVGAMLLAFCGVVVAQQTEDGGAQRSAEDRAGPGEFAEGEVLVKFEPGTPTQDIAKSHRQNGGQVKETIRGIGVQVVGVARGQEKTAVARYRQNPNVRYAELNGVYEAVGSVPNDLRVGIAPRERAVGLEPRLDALTDSGGVELEVFFKLLG